METSLEAMSKKNIIICVGAWAARIGPNSFVDGVHGRVFAGRLILVTCYQQLSC